MRCRKLTGILLVLLLTTIVFCSLGCDKAKQGTDDAEKNVPKAVQSVALICPTAPAKPELSDAVGAPVLLKSTLRPGDRYLFDLEMENIVSLIQGDQKIDMQMPIHANTKIEITTVDQNGIISGVYTPTRAQIQVKGPMEASWDSENDPKTWPNDISMRKYLDVVKIPIPFKLSPQHKLIQVDYSALEGKLVDRYSEAAIIEIKKDTESDISNLFLELPATPVQVGDTIPGHTESMDLEGGGHLDVITSYKILAMGRDGRVLLEPVADFSGESPADVDDFHLFIDGISGWELMELNQGLVGNAYMNFCFRTTFIKSGTPGQTGMIAKAKITVTRAK